ncbi:hypothetical protein ACFL1F_01275, partial [Chlamydiota bacterium]
MGFFEAEGRRKYAMRDGDNVYITESLLQAFERPGKENMAYALFLHEQLDTGDSDDLHARAWQEVKRRGGMYAKGMMSFTFFMIEGMEMDRLVALIDEYEGLGEEGRIERGWGQFEEQIYNVLYMGVAVGILHELIDRLPWLEERVTEDGVVELIVDLYRLAKPYFKNMEQAYDYFSGVLSTSYDEDSSMDLVNVLTEAIDKYAADIKAQEKRDDELRRIRELMVSYLPPVIVGVVGREKIIGFIEAQNPGFQPRAVESLGDASDGLLVYYLKVDEWLTANGVDLNDFYLALGNIWPDIDDPERFEEVQAVLMEDFRESYDEDYIQDADDLKAYIVSYVYQFIEFSGVFLETNRLYAKYEQSFVGDMWGVYRTLIDLEFDPMYRKYGKSGMMVLHDRKKSESEYDGWTTIKDFLEPRILTAVDSLMEKTPEIPRQELVSAILADMKRYFDEYVLESEPAYAKELSPGDEEPLSDEDLREIQEKAEAVTDEFWQDKVAELNAELRENSLVHDDRQEIELYAVPSPDGKPYLEGEEGQRKYAVGIPGEDGRLKVYVSQWLLDNCQEYPEIVLALLLHESLDKGKKGDEDTPDEEVEGTHAWAWQMVKESKHKDGMKFLLQLMVDNIDDLDKVNRLISEFEDEQKNPTRGWETGQGEFEGDIYQRLVARRNLLSFLYSTSLLYLNSGHVGLLKTVRAAGNKIIVMASKKDGASR